LIVGLVGNDAKGNRNGCVGLHGRNVIIEINF
jgi:hypothetical protein